MRSVRSNPRHRFLAKLRQNAVAARLAREQGLFVPVYGAHRQPMVDTAALELRTIEQRCLAAAQAGASRGDLADGVSPH